MLMGSKKHPSPYFWTPRRLASGNLAWANPLDPKRECGTLASNSSPPSLKRSDLGLLLLGMDDLYGMAPKRVVSIPWSLIPGCPGHPGRQ